MAKDDEAKSIELVNFHRDRIEDHRRWSLLERCHVNVDEVVRYPHWFHAFAFLNPMKKFPKRNQRKNSSSSICQWQQWWNFFDLLASIHLFLSSVVKSEPQMIDEKTKDEEENGCWWYLCTPHDDVEKNCFLSSLLFSRSFSLVSQVFSSKKKNFEERREARNLIWLGNFLSQSKFVNEFVDH